MELFDDSNRRVLVEELRETGVKRDSASFKLALLNPFLEQEEQQVEGETKEQYRARMLATYGEDFFDRVA